MHTTPPRNPSSHPEQAHHVITKKPETPEPITAGPAGSRYTDGANRPEFMRSPHGVPLCITSCHNKSVTALAIPSPHSTDPA